MPPPRREIPPVALVSLMRQDGIEVPSGGGERPIRCPLPHHDDQTASASVNVAKGLFHCHACQKGGNAFTYLVDCRRLSATEASKLLQDQFQWTGAHIDSAVQRDEPGRAKSERRPNIANDIRKEYRAKGGAVGKLIAQHDYRDASGRLLWTVARYDQSQSRQVPKTLPYTPRRDGGYWLAGPKSDLMPEHDRLASPLFPLYRLPDLLSHLEHKPDAQVWVVEGEKCADAIHAAQEVNNPVVAAFGGTSRKIQTVDWSPLNGCKVVLIADSDEPGRRYMRLLGQHLVDHQNCQVRYVLPPGDDGFDVYDVIARDGPAGVKPWAKSIGVLDHDDIVARKTERKTRPPAPPMGETPHFEVLGMREQRVLIQSRTTHLLHEFSVGQLMQPGPLFEIAPKRFWFDHLMGDWSQATREQVADSLMEAARKRGQVGDRIKFYRLGAFRSMDDSVKFNVGDGILSPGDDGLLTVRSDLTSADEGMIFLPGAPMEMTDDPRAAQWCREFYSAVMAYRWETPLAGRTFLGWIVSSIVGGSLPFRPMLWLTAPADSGKTYLFSDVLSRFCGPLLREVSDATAAGLAAAANRDSLPIYMDEFEPGRTPREVERFEELLKMVRLATSGGGGRVRGTQTGGLVHVQPRFSVMCASIQWPRLSEADASRFLHVTLSHERVANWPSVRDALRNALTPERCVAMRTRIVRHAGAIVARARQIEDEMLEQGKQSTRQAQILSALTAGAGFLSGDYDPIERRRESQRSEFEPLDNLLSAIVRRPGGDVTLAEALRQGYYTPLAHFAYEKMQRDHEMVNLAQRYGIRMVGPDEMWIAPDTPPLLELLRRTRWSGIDLGQYLTSLPGAMRARTQAGGYVRMKVGETMRGVVVLTAEALDRLGFQPSAADTD